MKRLKYIYTLLVAILLGFFSFACSDDDVEQTEAENPAEEYSGEPITTTVKVCVSAPDVSVDVDTRAGGDKANIEYEQPENGGRFQNIVVVVTDNSDKVYAIHCNKWYNNSNPTSAGMKQYEVIFPDLKINDSSGKVYAFGNVSTDVYETISGYTVSGTTALSPTYMPEVYKLKHDTTTISADDANLHKLSFTPKNGNFKVGGQSVKTTCSGMPVNAMAKATIQKGATIFNVHMKRVCARLQVTFRNFTGQYIDYDSGESKDNNVYVDNFVLKKVLLNSSKYFYNGSAPSTAGSVDFNILKVLKNDHEINKIENGKEITVSMYVFENKKGNTSGAYTYDLKVDRGKSLGTNTTVIDPENAYVIWNRINRRSIAFKTKVCASDLQTTHDKIPFRDQVFWQLERNGSINNAYLLKRRQLNVDNDLLIASSTSYLKKVADPDWDSDKYKEIEGALTEKKSEAQYIQVLQNGSENEFTMSLMGSSSIDYWGYHTYYILPRKVYSMLTINEDKLCNRSSEYVFIGSQQRDNYEWTLYAKYIMKTGVAFKGNGSNIPQIERNHSYELDFSVMRNYDTKQELLVKCVRRQNDVDWSETQK